MKRIIYIVICLILISCDMDLNPLSQGSSESWYSNETELLMSVRRLYELSYWQGIDDIHTDDMHNRTELTEVTGGTMNSQSSLASGMWTRSYSAIAQANTILDNLDKAKQHGVSEKVLTQCKAEALFVRAAQYARLVFHFGDVVYVTSSINNLDDAFHMGRTNKAEILKDIYADFDAAAADLPMTYSAEERATKGAAYAFKARLALHMGDYQLAAEAAKKCIDLEIYFLHEDFSSLFLTKTKSSKEFIFTRPRSVELNQTVGTQVWISRSAGGYAQYNPTWDLLCAFLCTDGEAIDVSPLYDPHNPFKNRDPRCAATIVEFGTRHLNLIYEPHPDTLRIMNFSTGVQEDNRDSRTVAQYASYNGLLWKKWVDESYLQNGFKADKAEIVMRYADVLLMYAEAKIELGEVDQSVLDAINSVRSRAYGVKKEDVTLYPAVTTTEVSELRRILRVERRMEFAFEGIRYMDLIRWKIAEKALNKATYGLLDTELLRKNVVDKGLWFFPDIPEIDENGISDFTEMYNKGLIKLLITRKFDANKQYLWPIPTTEIQINPNIKQNPNY